MTAPGRSSRLTSRRLSQRHCVGVPPLSDRRAPAIPLPRGESTPHTQHQSQHGILRHDPCQRGLPHQRVRARGGLLDKDKDHKPQKAARNEGAGRGTPRFYLPFPSRPPRDRLLKSVRLQSRSASGVATLRLKQPTPAKVVLTFLTAGPRVPKQQIMILATSNKENPRILSFLFCFGTRGPLPKMFPTSPTLILCRRRHQQPSSVGRSARTAERVGGLEV